MTLRSTISMAKTDSKIPRDQMSAKELLNAIGEFKTTIPLDPVPPGDDPVVNEIWIRERALMTRAFFEQFPQHEAALACIHEHWMLMEMQPHLFLSIQDQFDEPPMEVTGSYRKYDLRNPRERERWREARNLIANQKKSTIEQVLAEHPHLTIANWAHDTRIEELRAEILDFDASEGQPEQLMTIARKLLSSVNLFRAYQDSIETPKRNKLYPDYWQISRVLAEESLYEAVEALSFVGVEEQSRFLSDAEHLLTDTERVIELRAKLESVNQPFKLSFEDLASGEFVDISEYVGEVVLIDFWATWCKPCLDQIPHLKRLLRRYQDRRLRILGISCDTPDIVIDDQSQIHCPRSGDASDQLASLVIQCARTHGIEWPICIDKGFADRWRVKSIPTIFAVDRKGALRSTNISGNLDSSIEELLDE